MPASKKARVVDEWDLDGLADQLSPSISEDEGIRELMTSRVSSSSEAGVDHDEGSGEEDQHDEDLATGPKRKRKSTGMSKIRSSTPQYEARKKHNLWEMAKKGHGGRIMFVLEKVTESKMT